MKASQEIIARHKQLRAAGHWVPPAKGEVLTREEKAFAKRRRNGGDLSDAKLYRSIEMFFEQCDDHTETLRRGGEYFFNDTRTAKSMLEFGRRLYNDARPSDWVFQLMWAIGHCRCLAEVDKKKRKEMLKAVEAAIDAVEKVEALGLELVSVPDNPIDINALYEWNISLALLSDPPREDGKQGAFASYFAHWVVSEGMREMNEHVASVTQTLFDSDAPFGDDYISKLRNGHPDRHLTDSLAALALHLFSKNLKKDRKL